MALAEDCNRLTEAFPKSEMFGLTSQIRRAAVSIPANIAEGYGRGQTGSYTHFLRISQGSARELETLLLLSRHVGLVNASRSDPLLRKCDDISRMLHGLIRSIKPASEA
jgi:four helix bundle protein